MFIESAQLRDVTVEPNPPAVAAPVEPVAAPAAPAINKEALELGELLIGSGVTRETVNDLLQAPQALQTMRYLLQNNPQEFLNLVERTDPATGEKFLESMADTYVKRYAPKDNGKPAGKSADSELMGEVEALRATVQGFQSEREAERQRTAMAVTKANYNGRVSELFNSLPKEVSLTKAEVTALKAQLQTELADDTTAVQRIANGNFVDVPRKFKEIIEGWSADKKASAEAAKTAREGKLNFASPEFLSGAQPFSVDAKTFDSWEGTEDGFAKALERIGG